MKHAKKWRDTIDHDVAWGKSLLLETGQMIPMFILHNRDGSITPFIAPFRDDEQKRLIFGFFSVLIIAQEAVGFSFMCEGWMIIAPKHADETDKAAYERAMDGPSPSQSEHRKEVFTCMTVYRDSADERRVLSYVAEMDRGWDGVLKGFIEIGSDGIMVEGAVMNIMSEDPPTREEVHKARFLMVHKAQLAMDQLGIHAIEDPRK